MPKASTSADARQARRHNPLSEDYAPTHPLKQKAAKRKKANSDNRDDEGFVDSKASRKILKIGQDLADEEELEQNARRPPKPNPAFAFESRLDDGVESDEEVVGQDDDDAWGDEDEEEIVEEIVRAVADILW